MLPEPARPQDYADIAALLGAAELPADDLTPEHLADFLVMRDGDTLAGVVGMDVRDDVALLRSLAVDARSRGAGVAGRLVAELEAGARARGVRELYLLTTTADGYFAHHGYDRIAREEVPAILREHPQFLSLCPSTAVCMRKTLPFPAFVAD